VAVEVRNGRVEVAGEVAEPEDFRQIEAMSRADPRVRSRVRLTRDVIGTVADAVREAIGVPGLRVRAVRDRVVLEGVVSALPMPNAQWRSRNSIRRTCSISWRCGRVGAAWGRGG